MRICVLFSEELATATLTYLQGMYPKRLFVKQRHKRDDSVAYEFELTVEPGDVADMAGIKSCTAHFLNGYRAGISQCETIVKGEGIWENDAVQASVDNLS